MADQITLVTARCRSWLCPHCGPWLGRTLRHRLIMRSAEWQEPILITLTCGRADWGHATPLDAYNHVAKQRYIARLMQALGVKRWVSILEPQGDGYPHWHILADGENRVLDYKLLHRLWSKLWKIGSQVDIKRDWSSASNAINYITKYLIKRSEKYPPWMYEKKRIRLVQGSRSVGPLTGDGRGRNGKATADDTIQRVSRIPAVRVAECGATLVHVDINPDTCEVIGIERVAIIPKREMFDLSGIGYDQCPFTGARTMSVSRDDWARLALAWRDPLLQVRRQEWIRVRVAGFRGFGGPVK